MKSCIIQIQGEVSKDKKPHGKGSNTMARQKKKGDQDKTLKILVMVTAILNLIRSLVDIINKLLE